MKSSLESQIIPSTSSSKCTKLKSIICCPFPSLFNCKQLLFDFFSLGTFHFIKTNISSNRSEGVHALLPNGHSTSMRTLLVSKFRNWATFYWSMMPIWPMKYREHCSRNLLHWEMGMAHGMTERLGKPCWWVDLTFHLSQVLLSREFPLCG